MNLYMFSAKLWPFCFGHNMLTHCGLVTPYGVGILVNIGSGNVFLLDGTKHLPEQMLTYLKQVPLTFIADNFYLSTQDIHPHIVFEI